MGGRFGWVGNGDAHSNLAMRPWPIYEANECEGVEGVAQQRKNEPAMLFGVVLRAFLKGAFPDGLMRLAHKLQDAPMDHVNGVSAPAAEPKSIFQRSFNGPLQSSRP